MLEMNPDPSPYVAFTFVQPVVAHKRTLSPEQNSVADTLLVGWVARREPKRILNQHQGVVSQRCGSSAARFQAYISVTIVWTTASCMLCHSLLLLLLLLLDE